MTKAEKYVTKFLLQELEEIKVSTINSEVTGLDIYEKTIVYRYTYDGYEDLNKNLRKSNGINNSPFGILLDKIIHKLPSIVAVVYRGVYINNSQFEKYKLALKNNTIVIEPTFISTSKSRKIAEGFGNTLFRIVSKSGKLIENISKFGIHNPPSEQEVIFRPNRKFRVLEIDTNIITLEEI